MRRGESDEESSALTYTPANAEEAAVVVRESRALRIVGTNTKFDFGRSPSDCDVLSTLGMSGIVDWSPEDLVVVVRAGTRVSDLLAELATKNQYIPIPPCESGLERLTAGLPGTIGGMVCANLPTRWDSWSKGIRYWVLGLTVVRANGEIARCGSKAVKNVAGYDVQKLFIGSWGTLGLITDVVLRVFALPRDLQSDDNLVFSDTKWDGSPPFMIARAPRSRAIEYAKGLDGSDWVVDVEAGTIWSAIRRRVAPPPDGWALYAGLGDWNGFDPCENVDLVTAIKSRLDPEHKFNPGMIRLNP